MQNINVENIEFNIEGCLYPDMTREDYESKIQELNKKIESLQTPPKQKKTSNVKANTFTAIVTSSDDGGTF